MKRLGPRNWALPLFFKVRAENGSVVKLRASVKESTIKMPLSDGDEGSRSGVSNAE